MKGIIKDNSFMTKCPEIAKEWNYEKNASLSPIDLSYGSGIKVWWRCSQNHEWLATVHDRSSGKGCPYCSGRKVLKGYNDLASISPNVAKEWNYEKNKSLLPTEVTNKSGRKVWWKCNNGHEWEMIIATRTQGRNCPYCSRRRVIKGETDLTSTMPQLVKQWDYEMNYPLKPEDVSKGSDKKVWWKCFKGHEWQSTISNRVLGTNCPFCSNKKVLKGFNDLSTTNPELVAEWDYEKNYPLTPQTITRGSSKKVWWKCKNGHEWKVTIANRTQGYNCPFCSGQRLIRGENDLVTAKPAIAAEWNNDKNGSLTPYDVTKSANIKVWWKCIKGHEWQATINSRSQECGCPICANQKILIGYNDLATVNPALALEWNYEKNNPLKPQEVISGSNKKVWWKCYKGHEWQALISSRNKGSGCPICNKERQTSFPEQTLFFYIKKYFSDAVNTETDAIGMELDIFIPSKKIAVEYDGIAWHKNKKSVEKRKDEACNKAGIYLIRVREKGLEEDNNCALCIIRKNYHSDSSLMDVVIQTIKCIDEEIVPDVDIERDRVEIYNLYISKEKMNSLQFLFPQIALEWHPILNGKLTPDKVPINSNKKVWWKCLKGHEWQTSVAYRSKGGKCPYCSGRYVIKGETDIVTTNPVLLGEWDYEKNYPLTPQEVTAMSGKKVWWRCLKGHLWQAAVYGRTSGSGCPICANKKVLIGYNDLEKANPNVAKEWNYEKNYPLTPKDVIVNSGKKVWWICHKGHDWYTSVSVRTRGSGCPICSNKQVLKGYNDLTTTNPKLAAEWNYEKNYPLTPCDVTKSASKKVWWKCSFGHEWEVKINNRAQGTGCPICKGRHILIGFNDLASINPDLASEWNNEKNYPLTAFDVTRNSGKKVWWRCHLCGYEWEASIANRSKGRGCPKCALKLND